MFQEGTENWKICLTDANVDAAIEFFHTLFVHPGQAGLLRGMRLYHHPELTRKIRGFNCDICQKVKTGERGFGHLAPRDVTLAPWQYVDVDLIGPWSIQVGGTRRNSKRYEFSALTCIDRTTAYPDGCRVVRKTPGHVSQKFTSAGFHVIRDAALWATIMEESSKRSFSGYLRISASPASRQTAAHRLQILLWNDYI